MIIQPPAERIIFIPFIDAFGGAERLVLDLSRFLYERQISHTIACFRETIELQSYANWPLNILRLSSPRNPFAEALVLARFLRSTQQSPPPLLFDLKSAFYSGMLSGAPFFLHLTDPPSLLPADISKQARSTRRDCEGVGSGRTGPIQSLRAELVHRLNRRGARRAIKAIVMTGRIRNELQQLYNVDALILPPGVSSNSPIRSTACKQAKSGLRMLSVSRLEPNKRIDWILRAIAAFDRTTPEKKRNWELEIVGMGSAEASLKRLADQLGLADRTLFLGHVSDKCLAAAYSRANLFLMPAVQGYGLPALEALHRGLPTIVHRDSGVSEFLQGSPWVEIIDGENESLARAIETMAYRLEKDALFESSLPRVPTDSEWARAVCDACQWI